jgi:molecular chaperone HtpG
VRRLEGEKDEARFKDLGLILLDQAELAEGGQLDDPAGFVGRLNGLMMNLLLSGR